MNDATIKLLTDIRDLLVPIAEVARPQYEKILRERHQEAIKAIIEIVGRSPKQIQAVGLMDGSRKANDIRTITGFDSANFSKFVKRLREAGVLQEPEGKLALTVSPAVIEWPKPGGSRDN